MYNLGRRLGKIEKKLGVGKKPYLVNILGMEVSSDEFKGILEAINGKTKGVLPSEDPNDSSGRMTEVQKYEGY
jgi:hypothetical protein